MPLKCSEIGFLVCAKLVCGKLLRKRGQGKLNSRSTITFAESLKKKEYLTGSQVKLKSWTIFLIGCDTWNSETWPRVCARWRKHVRGRIIVSSMSSEVRWSNQVLISLNVSSISLNLTSHFYFQEEIRVLLSHLFRCKHIIEKKHIANHVLF